MIARIRRPPAAAVILVAVEAAVAHLAGPQAFLALIALVVAPGLAALPFLPREFQTFSARVAAVPVIGLTLAALIVISLGGAGLPITATSIRCALLVLSCASLILAGRWSSDAEPASGWSRRELGVVAVLAAIGCLAATLQQRVLGTTPLPGQDWGHYLLYVDEIRRHHSLDLVNPYWMLGGKPFPDDPGMPAVYAAFGLMSGVGTGSLVQGIWLVALVAGASCFVCASILWGRAAGLVAAGLYAAVPMNLDMLGWHGLANVHALTLMPLLVLCAAMALRGRLGRRWACLTAFVLLGLAVGHRPSLLFGLAVSCLVAPLVVRRAGRRAVAFIGWTGCVTLIAGSAVLVELVDRSRAIGAINADYRSFLDTKVDWTLVGRDLTVPLELVGAVAIAAFAVPRLRRDPATAALVAVAVAILGFSYAWIVHVPFAYNRAPYYAPLLVALAVAATWSVLLPRWTAVAVAALIAVTALKAHDVAPVYRSFYGYANAGSLRGLGLLKARIRADEAVVTDNCWGFLSPWLLQQRVVAAQDRALIYPRSELRGAAIARQVLYGKGGASLARSRSIRYALVDPLCTHQDGQPVERPRFGLPIYASTRLLILDLAPGRPAA